MRDAFWITCRIISTSQRESVSEINANQPCSYFIIFGVCVLVCKPTVAQTGFRQILRTSARARRFFSRIPQAGFVLRGSANTSRQTCRCSLCRCICVRTECSYTRFVSAQPRRNAYIILGAGERIFGADNTQFLLAHNERTFRSPAARRINVDVNARKKRQRQRKLKKTYPGRWMKITRRLQRACICMRLQVRTSTRETGNMCRFYSVCSVHTLMRDDAQQPASD